MCGRFAIGINLHELPFKFNESVIHGNYHQEEEESDNVDGNEIYQFTENDTESIIEVVLTNFKSYRLSFNVAPTSSAFIIYMQEPTATGIKERYIVEASRFGLVPSWKKPKNYYPDASKGLELLKDIRSEQAKYFNCRKETLSQPRSIWNENKNRRCVIPIQGYFEWQKGTKEKTPYFVCSKNSPFIYLAGLYSHNTNYSLDEFGDLSEVFSTFTIVTGPASPDDLGDLSWLHSRKPIVLESGSKEWYDWLNPSKKFNDSFFDSCLNTKDNLAYSSIKTYRVSRDVGKTSAQGEYLIKEIKEEQKPITMFFSRGVKRNNENESIEENKKIKRDDSENKKDIANFFKVKSEE